MTHFLAWIRSFSLSHDWDPVTEFQGIMLYCCRVCGEKTWERK